ncbi:glucokinase [Undibacterium sp. LX40W]|uniref:Glucokinase n=1 Tax=Undibacterium nitidum TaxID=2762298 RepID=A0A923HP87_9BURK|nr:glucokinase [Undibacterium nitidum]MBC3883180.1 glucokinase [Undibacterium nitidum]MBC3893462.1 glucokinase [Undibacterium sp. LX40W]
MSNRLQVLSTNTGTSTVVADIGGTHARLAMATWGGAQDTISLAHLEKFACRDFTTLESLLQHYQSRHTGAQALDMVLAVAAPIIHGDVAAQANMPWPVRIQQLRQTFPQQSITLLNDFVALAHAVPTLQEADLQLLCGTPSTEYAGPVLVMGPGTGLGAAYWLPGHGGQASQVLASEAGHISLAASTALETAIVQELRKQWSYVNVERVLSGPGLINIYQALCTLEAREPHLSSPAAITEAAMANTDPLAVTTLNVFCEWLGSVAADLCISSSAQRVILAGGIPSLIWPFLQHSGFASRFTNKGVMTAVMRQSFVQVIDHGQLALVGAAQFAREHRSTIS